MKSIQECYEALLAGKKLKYENSTEYVFLENGMQKNSKGNATIYSFNRYEDWSILEEPKTRNLYLWDYIESGYLKRTIHYYDDNFNDTMNIQGYGLFTSIWRRKLENTKIVWDDDMKMVIES